MTSKQGKHTEHGFLNEREFKREFNLTCCSRRVVQGLSILPKKGDLEKHQETNLAHVARKATQAEYKFKTQELVYSMLKEAAPLLYKFSTIPWE